MIDKVKYMLYKYRLRNIYKLVCAVTSVQIYNTHVC